MACIYGQMVVNMLEIEKKIKCMEKVFLVGEMEENMKVNTKMIKNMGKILLMFNL